MPSAGLKVEKRDFFLLHEIDHCQLGSIQPIFWLIELTVNFNFAMNIMLPFIIQSEGVLCSSQTSIKLCIIVWGNVCIGKSHIGMALTQLTTGMSIIQILQFKAIMPSFFGIFLLILCQLCGIIIFYNYLIYYIRIIPRKPSLEEIEKLVLTSTVHVLYKALSV